VHFAGGAVVGLVVSLGMLALTPGGAGGQAHAAVSIPAEIGRVDEGLRLAFTPATFAAGSFAVHRSAEAIDRLAARLRALDPAPAPGAWQVQRAGVFDAFGGEGPYDKARLARLFGGSLPSVARGTLVTTAGRRAFTLISPCPDASISLLRPETMVIVTRLPVQ
jgi:hypothetical protein